MISDSSRTPSAPVAGVRGIRWPTASAHAHRSSDPSAHTLVLDAEVLFLIDDQLAEIWAIRKTQRSAWVPTTISTVPSSTPSSFPPTPLGSADQREACEPDRKAGEALRRSYNAGATGRYQPFDRGISNPSMAAMKAARNATSVLPETNVATRSRRSWAACRKVFRHRIDGALLVVGFLIKGSAVKLAIDALDQDHGGRCAHLQRSAAMREGRPPRRTGASSAGPCGPAMRRRQACQASRPVEPWRDRARCSPPAGTGGHHGIVDFKAIAQLRRRPEWFSGRWSGRCRDRHERRCRRPTEKLAASEMKSAAPVCFFDPAHQPVAENNPARPRRPCRRSRSGFKLQHGQRRLSTFRFPASVAESPPEITEVMLSQNLSQTVSDPSIQPAMTTRRPAARSSATSSPPR